MMRFTFLGVLAVLIFSSSIVRAQTVSPTPPSPNPPPTTAPAPGPPPCPTVAVLAQAGRRIRDGERINFAVNITGGDPKVVPTIVWSTSAGSITQGHNTRRIELDTTGAGSTPDREVKADVWVGGYAPQCLLQASATVKVIPPAVKFGEFGLVEEETLKKNLDALSTYFSQSPDNLYMIAYAGRNSERGFASSWLGRMKESLVTAGIAPGRIAAVDGGFREEPLFDFWIVPAGAEPPPPTPTIKRSEIVYPPTRRGRKP